MEDVSLNTAAAAGEARSVTVECRNPQDEVVFSSSYPWPFTDTDNGTLDPPPAPHPERGDGGQSGQLPPSLAGLPLPPFVPSGFGGAGAYLVDVDRCGRSRPG